MTMGHAFMHSIHVGHRLPGALLVLSLGMFVAGGCSDTTGSTDDLVLRFRANGALVEYTTPTSLLATFSQSGSQYNAVISGLDGASTFTLQVYDEAAIQPSTYAGYTIAANAFVGVLIQYETAGAQFTQVTTAPADARITITELSETRVAGTFEGRLTAAGQGTLMITEGVFLVQRVN